MTTKPDRDILRAILRSNPERDSLLDRVKRHLLSQQGLDLTRHYDYWMTDDD